VDSVESPENDNEASLKQLRDLKAGFDLLKNLLAKMESVYSHAEGSVQDELGKRSRVIEAKDAAIAELKEGLLLQLRELKEQLDAKDELLRNRDVELESLRSEVSTWAQRAAESEHAETMLREELDKRQSALEAKESALGETERSFGLRLDEVENHLRAKENLLKDRDAQIEELRSEVSALAQRFAEMKHEKEQGEGMLRQELVIKNSLVEAKDSEIRELQENLDARIQELQNQLSAKAELLENRDGQLEQLRSEAAALGQRLGQIESDRERAETELRMKLNGRESLIEAKDSAIAELEENMKTQISDLGAQLSVKEEVLKNRDHRLEELASEVSMFTQRLAEINSDREQTENALREELRKKEELLQAMNSAIKIKELKENLSTKIQNDDGQLIEEAPVDPFEILLSK
jgi:chromosome segregation ATPase